MKFFKRYFLAIFCVFYALLYSSIAIGGELIPFLKGKWVGTALYRATYTGFSSSKDSINLNISRQSILNFGGNAESKNNGEKRQWVFKGYLGERGRNICIINQSDGKMLVGYVITNINRSIIKLYSWDDRNNKAIVYILRKIESADN